jgi:hypothetical protein
MFRFRRREFIARVVSAIFLSNRQSGQNDEKTILSPISLSLRFANPSGLVRFGGKCAGIFSKFRSPVNGLP